MNFYFVKIIFEHCCAHILQKTYFFGMHREGGKTTGRCLKIFFVFLLIILQVLNLSILKALEKVKVKINNKRY